MQPAHGFKRKRASARVDLAPLERHHVAISQHHAQRAHVRTHGAVAVAARTGGVARRHAAQAGRGLRGIRWEKLGGRGVELFEHPQVLIHPTRAGNGFICQVLAQLRQDDAGLHREVERAVPTAACAQAAVHVGQVHHVPTVRHRARGQARASPLHGHGGAGSRQLGENRGDLILSRRKRDALRLALGARFVTAVLVIIRTKRLYLLHARLIPRSFAFISVECIQQLCLNPGRRAHARRIMSST